jgi:hypothetical protein
MLKRVIGPQDVAGAGVHQPVSVHASAFVGAELDQAVGAGSGLRKNFDDQVGCAGKAFCRNVIGTIQ